MGCGKSKQSVAVDDRMLLKGQGTNATDKNLRLFEKGNADEVVEGKVREEDSENLNTGRRVGLDNVDAKALPCPEDVTEMPTLPREEGMGHEDQKQREEKEEEEDVGVEEESKGAALEEDKDVSLEDGHGDGDNESGRLISRDSLDHSSSRKDDEALEGILSEYDSPVHVEANKPIPRDADWRRAPRCQ